MGQAEHDIDQFFGNANIQKALSELGVFAIDYGRHRAMASSVWLACGYTAEQMNDQLFLDILHPDDKVRVLSQLDEMTVGTRDAFDGVFRLQRADGSWVWLAANYRITHRDSAGRPLLFIGHDHDVTAIKEAEQESLRRLQEIETLRQVIADVNSRLDLNDTVDLVLNHSRRVIPYDRSSVQILEGGRLRVLGCTGFEDREAILQVTFEHPDAGNPGSVAIRSRVPILCNDIEREFPGFHQVPGTEATRSWLGIPLIANNEVIGLLALDSTQPHFYTARHRELAEIFAAHVAMAMEKAKMFEMVRSMALTDLLTGAGNRHALQLQGPFFLEKAKREQRRILALMIDLDHFKQINDNFGHDAGDAVLQDVSTAIRACLRSYDLFFRFGGEEFLVLLPDTEVSVAEEIAQRIRGAMESAPTRTPAFPTVSLGLGSLVPSASMTLSDLIKVADRALYEAKETGRNRLVIRSE